MLASELNYSDFNILSSQINYNNEDNGGKILYHLEEKHANLDCKSSILMGSGMQNLKQLAHSYKRTACVQIRL